MKCDLRITQNNRFFDYWFSDIKERAWKKKEYQKKGIGIFSCILELRIFSIQQTYTAFGPKFWSLNFLLIFNVVPNDRPNGRPNRLCAVVQGFNLARSAISEWMEVLVCVYNAWSKLSLKWRETPGPKHVAATSWNRKCARERIAYVRPRESIFHTRYKFTTASSYSHPWQNPSPYTLCFRKLVFNLRSIWYLLKQIKKRINMKTFK